jgi:hypothetical protein
MNNSQEQLDYQLAINTYNNEIKVEKYENLYFYQKFNHLRKSLIQHSYVLY